MSYNSAQAILQGLAEDGGLLTPGIIPKLLPNAFESMRDMSYQQRAVYLMTKFLPEFTTNEVIGFVQRAYQADKFDHPDVAPVHKVDKNTWCLELWHGPTAAFKDMALQMLPQLLSASLNKTMEQKNICILVATSGDTGKAALEGFKDVPRTKILVFYPRDGVSEIQALQMRTQEGSNVGVVAVNGNFDDAQSGVKALFSDPEVRKAVNLSGYSFSSANSINWGRVLPQIVYYISAYCDLLKSGEIQVGQQIDFCVPTGNFGNILAGYYAKMMGLPIRRLICASNHNNVLTDFINTGVYDRNRPFYNTISPSMDILVSSNLERLLYSVSGQNTEFVRRCMAELAQNGRYEVGEEIRKKIAATFAAGYCDDECTKQFIGAIWKEYHYLIDPHTAVAFSVLYDERQKREEVFPTVVVSTASPYKFCPSVLSALGDSQAPQGMEAIDRLAELTGVTPPAPLSGLAGKPVRFNQWIEKEQMLDAVMSILQMG